MSEEDAVGKALEEYHETVSPELERVEQALAKILQRGRIEDRVTELERAVEKLQDRQADAIGALWALVDFVRSGE